MAFNLLLKSQLERFVDNLFPQIYSYGTCSTGKNDVAKVVALTGFILMTFILFDRHLLYYDNTKILVKLKNYFTRPFA